MDDFDEDFNRGDWFDRAKAAREHADIAAHDTRRAIDRVTNARLDGGVLSGRELDELLRDLLEIEGDISRFQAESSFL